MCGQGGGLPNLVLLVLCERLGELQLEILPFGWTPACMPVMKACVVAVGVLPACGASYILSEGRLELYVSIWSARCVP